MRILSSLLLAVCFPLAAGCSAAPIVPAVDEDTAASTAMDDLTKRWNPGGTSYGLVYYLVDLDGVFAAEHPDHCGEADSIVNATEPDAGDFSDPVAMLAAIHEAIGRLDALTPVRFEEVSPATVPIGAPYIVITLRDPAMVGSAAGGTGMPPLAGPWCLYLSDNSDYRTVEHEVGHRLGLHHEQSRDDRDDYIKYNPDPMCGVTAGPITTTAVHLAPYDLDSVMHYESCPGGAMNCPCPQILACDPPLSGTCTTYIPLSLDLSKHDINALFRMYEQPLDLPAPSERFGAAMASGDFDGDGYADVAVGAHGEDGMGAVFLYRGTGGSQGTELGRLVAWTVLRGTVADERFGEALATGDLDGDGIDDLAVGAPGTVGGALVGSVYLYRAGVNPRTLRPAGITSWQQLTVTGEYGDRFGAALASGDFDGDGDDELAVGAPRRRVAGARAGAVLLYRGGASPSFARQISQLDVSGAAAQEGDRFGQALQAGDVDVATIAGGAMPDDLLVGAAEEYSSPVGSGAVYYFRGVGPTSLLAGVQELRPPGSAPGLAFGTALALGAFTNDTSSGKPLLSLAVGAPSAGSSPAQAGAIYVYRRNVSTSPVTLTWAAPMLTLPGAATSDHLGEVLVAARSIDGTGPESLYAGVPDRDVGSAADGGLLAIYPGTSPGSSPPLGTTPSVLANPSPSAYDAFGSALVVANHDGSPGDDCEILVGVPGASSGAGRFDPRIKLTTWSWSTSFTESTANPE